MRIIREVRNALDGPYKMWGGRDEKDDKKKDTAGSGFREGESRIVRKLLELGLAIPETGDAKKDSRR